MGPNTRRGPLTGFDKGVGTAPPSGLIAEEAVDSEQGDEKLVPIGTQLEDLNRKAEGLIDIMNGALDRLRGGPIGKLNATARPISSGCSVL